MKRVMIAGIAIALTTAVGAEAKVVSGAGKLEYTDFVTSDNNATTDTGKFENVPDMVLNFTTEKKGSIVIKYCANTFAKGSDIIHKQVLLNGSKVFPKNIQFNGENPTFNRANCFIWALKNRKPGAYTVQMQHRSSGAGVTVFTNERTLTVRHR